MVLNTFTSFTPGQSLKCFFCESIVSWKDCKSNEQQVTCAPEYGTCTFTYINGSAGVAVYHKRCESSLHCDTYCDARRNLRQCQMRCCTGDLCNHGTDPKSIPDYKTQISCDKCKESKSCGKKKLPVTCTSGTEACMEKIATLKNGQKEYTMGCVPKEQCRKEESDCNKGKKQNCELHCCEERHCRGLLSASRGPGRGFFGEAHQIAGVFSCLALLLQ